MHEVVCNGILQRTRRTPNPFTAHRVRLFFVDVAGELYHLNGGEGTFGAFVAERSSGAVERLLVVVDGEYAEYYGDVAVAVEYCDALCDALAYVVEVRSASADDASEDDDGVVCSGFDEL